jgi:hypothetical protein
MILGVLVIIATGAASYFGAQFVETKQELAKAEQAARQNAEALKRYGEAMKTWRTIRKTC